MRSFRVTRAAPTNVVTVGDYEWTDLEALACRGCEAEKGVGRPGTEFIPDLPLAVGAVLTCPYCAERSMVPKRARWTYAAA